MNILDLPDEVLVNLFDKYLCRDQLVAIHLTCQRFRIIIDHYDLWCKYLLKVPAIDYNYPFGLSDFSERPKNELSSKRKLKLVFKWINNQYSKKVFYSFSTKMLPYLQIDEFTSSPLLYTTDANNLVGIKLKKIKSYSPSKFHKKMIIQPRDSNKKYSSSPAIKNDIQQVHKLEIFKEDIKNFIKKDDTLVSLSNNQLIVQTLDEKTNELSKILYLEENEYGNKINCADFSTQNYKLVYGCSDGFIKVHDIKKENLFTEIPIGQKNLHDRILRLTFSPSLNYLAIGTAAVKPYDITGFTPKPMRIYDFERLKELQTLKPSKSMSEYKKGAGILALSYIDENTVMSAGYDTFIRIFDTRSNICVQELEEPEDMSIYCVCVSKFYGLLSGTNRQSMIRYWDRRQAKIISTFTASNNNSSVYSLACTSNSIYAAWNMGLTAIDFS